MPNKPIFIHIPKTGGKSIQASLGNEITIIGHHRMASEVKNRVKFWDSVFKFSVIRNPWDRMVSTYHFKLKKEDSKVIGKSFDEWIINVLCKSKRIKTQCDFLMEDGKIIVDYVAKFENLKGEFREICLQIGVFKKLLYINNTNHKHYTYYYTKKSKNVIKELFKEEIKLFGYKYGK